MELKEIIETLQKAETKIKVQEEAIKHYKEDVKSLEKQLAESKKEIQERDKNSFEPKRVRTMKVVEEIFRDYDDLGKDCPHIYELQHQLTEKDKEIEKYANDLSIALSEQSDMAWKWTQSEKQIRHKVCDEIRKQEIRHRYDGDTNSVIDGYFVDKEILDQIEKGE